MSVAEVPEGMRGWRGPVTEPRAASEELEIRATDGTTLRAFVDAPPSGVPLAGTLVLAHALLSRKTSFGKSDRPGLASELAARGFRTVAFDFRGHGDSELGGSTDWGYDDLVRRDLPAVVECARARGEDKPVIVVGHSLGGNVALAAQGTGRIQADAIVAAGANVWIREHEPSLLRWVAKRAIAKTLLEVSARAGGLPARRLGLGTDDASPRYVVDLFRGLPDGLWQSGDGRDDYLASLANIRVPVAAVLGDRDRVLCHRSSGKAFAERCGGRLAFFDAPGGHRDLVRDPVARRVVADAVTWAISAISQARP